MTPVHYNVMRGKGEPDFVLSPFGVKELGPRQHVGALEQNDFQTAWAFKQCCIMQVCSAIELKPK